MKIIFHTYLRPYFVRLAFVCSGMLILGGWLWAYFALRGASTPLIIHFLPRGIDRIGGVGDLAMMGIFGLVVVALNFFLARELEKKDWLWGKVIAGSTLLFASLLFLAFLVIINAN